MALYSAILPSTISIHAPREGCDTIFAAHNATYNNFNPRTP